MLYQQCIVKATDHLQSQRTWRLRGVDVQGGVDCGVQVITFMVLSGVDQLHVEAAPRHVQHWGVEKVCRKFFALERCAGDDHLEGRRPAGSMQCFEGCEVCRDVCSHACSDVYSHVLQ